jgi:hypothetical protein
MALQSACSQRPWRPNKSPRDECAYTRCPCRPPSDPRKTCSQTQTATDKDARSTVLLLALRRPRVRSAQSPLGVRRTLTGARSNAACWAGISCGVDGPSSSASVPRRRRSCSFGRRCVSAMNYRGLRLTRATTATSISSPRSRPIAPARGQYCQWTGTHASRRAVVHGGSRLTRTTSM